MATTQRIIPGDCIAGMKTLEAGSVNCCVTSPPYWGLRDYGCDGQIGLEETPDAYVARIVEVFREVRRVLRDDGTCWVNLGDSYAATTKGTGGRKSLSGGGLLRPNGHSQPQMSPMRMDYGCLPIKPKDLVGIPWRVAFALQADGWWLRQDIIWHKPNPMPESVRDRCTKAHEYVFLLTKSERYFYNAEAVSEASVGRGRFGNWIKGQPCPDRKDNCRQDMTPTTTRNRRSVWTVTTKPYSGAHFAVMPPDLVEPCIKAGCPEGGTVLDPFAGSGTTLAVAAGLGRNAIGCELNQNYIKLAESRIAEARQSVALFEAFSAE